MQTSLLSYSLSKKPVCILFYVQTCVQTYTYVRLYVHIKLNGKRARVFINFVSSRLNEAEIPAAW